MAAIPIQPIDVTQLDPNLLPPDPVDLSGATDQPTSLSSGLGSGFSALTTLDDVLGNIGNFALGGFALSRLPASRIPVPRINTPIPVTNVASSATTILGLSLTSFLLVLAAIILLAVVFLSRRASRQGSGV